MGDDLSTGAKIGIGLVILCFLIAIVLALLMVVKNITNSGANQMEGGLNQMMQTTYDDYDQKIVTGTKVKSALKLFQGENIGICINNRLDKKDVTYCYGLLLEDYKSTKTVGTGSTFQDTYGEAYGADGAMEFRNDQVSMKGTPVSPAKFNLNTRPVDASGYDTYVRDNAKYMSYLVKDTTETIVGIYFVQQV